VKILRNIAIVLVTLLVLGAAIGFLLPAAVHVQRSIAIAAPPETVFDLLNSFKRYNEWSPWYDYDPAARYTYSGPSAGVGARMEWVSQKQEVGSGSQEITASEPPRRVAVHLEFTGQSPADAHYDIAPDGAGTRLTWGFDADFGRNIPYRYFGLFLDSLVGEDFEKGLARIKSLAESDAQQSRPAAPVEPTVEQVSARELVSVEGTTSLDPAAVAQALEQAFATINAFLAANGLQQNGAALAITRFYDESGWGFEAAVPVAGTPEAKARAARAAAKGIRIGPGYAGRALKSVHVGPHSTLPETYQRLEDYAAEKGLDSNGRPWEQYVTDPRKTPEEQLRTEVYMPVKAID
jgi:effector-binding domain-containing protein/carbon monoxide dehydrogenase subunit G